MQFVKKETAEERRNRLKHWHEFYPLVPRLCIDGKTYVWMEPAYRREDRNGYWQYHPVTEEFEAELERTNGGLTDSEEREKEFSDRMGRMVVTIGRIRRQRVEDAYKRVAI